MKINSPVMMFRSFCSQKKTYRVFKFTRKTLILLFTLTFMFLLTESLLLMREDLGAIIQTSPIPIENHKMLHDNTAENYPLVSGNKTYKDLERENENIKQSLWELLNDPLLKRYFERKNSSKPLLARLANEEGQINLAKVIVKPPGKEREHEKQQHEPVNMTRNVYRKTRNKFNIKDLLREPNGTFHCRPLSESSSQMPWTALASYQGSGNTWLRHLIQEATGLYTGSPYRDPRLRGHGFPAEGKIDNVVVIKTHGEPVLKGKPFQRAILLLRNPFETILAEFNRAKNNITKNGHTNLAPNASFSGKEWPHHVVITSANWFHFYNTWLDYPGIDMFTVVYKQLQMNLASTMTAVVKFLNVTMTREQFGCMLNNSKGNFHRKKRAKQPAVFTKDITALIKQQTRIINKKLLARFNVTVDDEVPI